MQNCGSKEIDEILQELVGGLTLYEHLWIRQLLGSIER